MSDFKISSTYLWIIITFLIPRYYKDNLDIQIGFHSNKNMILWLIDIQILIIYVEVC